MEPVIDVTPEAQEMVNKTETMAAEFSNMEITCQEDYSRAGESLKTIKGAAERIDTMRKSMTKPLDDSKKRIMDFFRRPLEILENAEKSLKRSMLVYQNEQDKKRREEEARIAAQQKAEAEKLEKRAEKAAASGKTDKAEELRAQAQQKASFAPVLAPTVEAVAGINTKTVWKCRIVNTDLIPREYMMPNDKMLNDIARATKGTLKIPGIEFYGEQIIAAGR